MLNQRFMRGMQGIYGHQMGIGAGNEIYLTGAPPIFNARPVVAKKATIAPDLKFMFDVIDDVIRRSEVLRTTGKYQLLLAADVFPMSGWALHCQKLVDHVVKRGYTVYAANSVQLKDVGSIWIVARHGHIKNDGQYRIFHLASKKTPVAVGNVDLTDLFKSIDALLEKSSQFKRLGVLVLKKVDLNNEARELFEKNIPAISEHLKVNGYMAVHYNAQFPTRLWVYSDPETEIHQKDKKTIYKPTATPLPVSSRPEIITPKGKVIPNATPYELAKMKEKMIMGEKNHVMEIERKNKRILSLEAEVEKLKASNPNDEINTLIAPSVGAGAWVPPEIEYAFVDDIQTDDLNERVADGWEVVSLTPVKGTPMQWDGASQTYISAVSPEVFAILCRTKK